MRESLITEIQAQYSGKEFKFEGPQPQPPILRSLNIRVLRGEESRYPCQLWTEEKKGRMKY